MTLILGICVGILWTLTYLLIIWRSFADRTYGMPFPAIVANVSWEFIFSVLLPPPLPRAFAIFWLALDLVILYTFLRFGPREFPQLRRRWFLTMTLGTFLLTFLGVWYISQELDQGLGYRAAYTQNFMMSALFIAMLLHRNSTRGQSPWIALTKLMGTAIASVSDSVYIDGRDTPLLIYLYASIFVLDLSYLIALIRVRARERSSRGV
jgi:hypothetical protein